MSSAFQKKIIAGACAGVAVLAAFGMGQAQGNIDAQSQFRRANVHAQTVTKIETKTVTVTVTKPVPFISDGCKRYFAVSKAEFDQLALFSTGYGGIQDQLNLAFDAIGMKNEDLLNGARIKLSNMDHAASDSFSQLISLIDDANKARLNCPEAK